MAHLAADLPTDTGYWSRARYSGYYRQPWARILEGAVFAIVAWGYAGFLP